jgi:hypothetical protein
MDSLRAFAASLRANLDLNILWREVTASEFSEFGTVVKVVIPEMVPLVQAETARWLATPRLHGTLGIKGRLPNSFPHPFA